MAWTTPRTWVTGELVTASIGNTHWRDNLNYLKAAADKAPQILVSNITQVGNIGTGEDDLITYSMPGNTLDTNGQCAVFTAGGTTAANGNAKTVKAWFGAQELITSNPGFTFNGAQSWKIEAHVWRLSATTQYASTTLWAGATQFCTALSTSPAETLSGAVVFKCTGEATSNDDVVQKALHGIKWPAP